MSRHADFHTEARVANRMVWDGLNKWLSLQREATALDYANTLSDGTGSNEGITASETLAVVTTTADALVTLLAAGHGTNISKLL